MRRLVSGKHTDFSTDAFEQGMQQWCNVILISLT